MRTTYNHKLILNKITISALTNCNTIVGGFSCIDACSGHTCGGDSECRSKEKAGCPPLRL